MAKKIVKIVLIAAVCGFVGTAGYFGIMLAIGADYWLPEDGSNYPEALFEWTLRGVNNDEPVKIWNAVSEGYRARFVDSFNKVRKGEADATPWVKAAAAAKQASNAEELKSLSDKQMFLVFWRLEDRKTAGVELPAYLEKGRGAAATATLTKVVYEGDGPDRATKSSVLYQIDGGSDVVSMTKVDGHWLLDTPRGMPAGL